MSIGVTIIPPTGLPDPSEPIASFAVCPGNIMTAAEEIGGDRLDDCSPQDAMINLCRLIRELDLGDAGHFSDSWCAETDLCWSRGSEMEEAWGGVADMANVPNLPGWMRTKRTYWGVVKRDQLRRTAVRFLLYYRSGYEVRWSK